MKHVEPKKKPQKSKPNSRKKAVKQAKKKQAQKGAAKFEDKRRTPANMGKNKSARKTTRNPQITPDEKPEYKAPIEVTKVQLMEVKPGETGMRLDRWFTSHFGSLPFSLLQKLIRTGQVRVDSGRVKAHSRLKEGQIVRVPPFKLEAPKPTSINEDDANFIEDLTLFQNDDFIVLNKPQGLAVQGGTNTDRHVDGMLRSVPNKDGDTPKLVHRLDKDTSGLLVVARTSHAARHLTAAFRTREVTKLYWALTASVPHPIQGKINLPLRRSGHGEGENMEPCSHNDSDGQRAVTLYAVQDHAGGKFGFVSLKPITGRTHQLRVHMAATGTPILNDKRYFNIENFEQPNGLGGGLQLHARYLKFQDPTTREWHEFTAPLSNSMAHSFKQLGFENLELDEELLEQEA